MTRCCLLASLLLAHVASARPADAQWLPRQPVALFDGAVRLAGDASATIGPRDDDAFFNYTDYEGNALRTLRLALLAEWRPSPRLAVLAELRTDDFARASVSAAFVRVRPVASLPLDVQAGRVPPVFGAFGRRRYASDRPLIGYPLAYQYLTSLRADAVPASADDLLRMRGRGWRPTFPIGSQATAAGLPIVSALDWDTGVQARWTASRVEVAAALTQGTLSNPRLVDDNGSRQVAARVLLRPNPAFALGASAAHGGWISDDLRVRAGAAQRTIGADVEYSAGHLVVRSEAIWTSWQMPFAIAPPEGEALDARGAWIEARYRFTPRLYLAGRIDTLSFSKITGTAAPGPVSWDAGVTRLEIGGGLTLQRNLVWRTSIQVNRRDGGRVPRRTYVASQVAWWF